MRSTFMGLETSKRGLFTQQTALYTTGHNISNANTLGYSRQRVNLQATSGYPYPGLNSPTYPGHLGTGVEAGSIQRVRDEFIDRQYRQETNKLGYWESRTNAISQIEDVVQEPSEYGIDEAFRIFWGSLQDVSTNPSDTSARKVAISRAEHLAESFNYVYKQLETIQGNLGNEIDVSVQDINSILKQIAAINKQIQEVEPNGYVPNDLYDARDLLVDELNEYIPVSIQRVPSGGNASSVAEGTLTITFNGQTLVDGMNYAEVTAFTGTPTDTGEVLEDKDGNPILDKDGNEIPLYTYDKVNEAIPATPFSGLAISRLGNPPVSGTQQATPVNQDDFEASKGKLLSLINSYGYDNGAGPQGYYPETMATLNALVSVFAQAFNAMHEAGFDLNGASGEPFFVGDGGNPEIFTAGNIKVNAEIVKDPSKLAASSASGEEGNGKWAIELANLQNKIIGPDGITIKIGDTTKTIVWGDLDASGTPTNTNMAHLDGATFQSFYKALIGKLGVDGEEASRLYDTSGTLLLSISNNRDSVSTVSLDEEMTSMIMFQQAYNANARMITVVDETLDKIINGMGRVGL